MKAISIRELHAATGKWVRRANDLGEVHVTDRGRIVAKLVPAAAPAAEPYFRRRKWTAAFRAIEQKLIGGADSTATISEERDQSVS